MKGAWGVLAAFASGIACVLAAACVGDDTAANAPASDASVIVVEAGPNAPPPPSTVPDAADDAGFRVTDLPGCALWYRGDLGVTTNDAHEVTKWADQSGSGDPTHDLTPADHLPTLDTLGGQAAMQFTSPDPTMANAGAYLRSGTFETPLVPPLTYYAVVRTPSNFGVPGTVAVFDGIGAAFQRASLKPTELVFEYNTGAGLVRGTSLTFDASDKTLLLTIVYDITEEGTSFTAKLDGGGVFTGGYSGGSFSSGSKISQLVVGANSSFANNLQGTLAELIAYRSAHDAIRRATVEGYLAERYGIR